MRLHSRDGRLAAVEDAAIVDRDNPVPGLGRAFDEGLELVPSGVVHEDIERAEFAFDGFDRSHRTIEAGDVEPHGACLATGCLDFIGGLRRDRVLDIGDCDLGALVRKACRDCAADSLSRARNDCDSPFEAGNPGCHFMRYNLLSAIKSNSKLAVTAVFIPRSIRRRR